MTTAHLYVDEIIHVEIVLIGECCTEQDSIRLNNKRGESIVTRKVSVIVI